MAEYATEQEQLEAFYASLIDGVTSLEDSASTEAYVTELFQAVLGRDPAAEGLANISAAIDGGTFNMDDFIYSALNDNYANPAFDYLTAEERTAAQAAQDALIAEQTTFNTANPIAEPEPEPEAEGDTIYLTSASDRGGIFDGTADADQFNAYMEQNPFAGGVSNSLSSADVLDGGAGTDTLFAELVPEFYGTNAVAAMDIQPKTSNIEIVELEAREVDTGWSDYGVTVDAKNMIDVDHIGSKFSDGDLIIENLTTQSSNGLDRNTEEMTITMDHTDNFNSDGDASDLTVYFDEDYLLTGQSTTESQANYWILDEDSVDYLIQPLENIERNGITLDIDGVGFEIKMDDAVAATKNDWNSFAAGLQDVITQRVADGESTLEGLSVIVDWDNTDSTFNDLGVEVTIPAITIVDEAGRVLEPTGFTSPEETTAGFDIYGRFDNEASETVDNPLAVDIDLHKVGREGEGGDLIVGGKELDQDAGAESQGNGINVFNIDVLGAANKLSNLGAINSTNNALQTVNIATHADYIDGETFASLTIRDGFSTISGSTYAQATGLEEINANAFLGDLNIGQDTAVLNADTFTALGGGDITYNAEINGAEKGNFTHTTGNGDDTIIIRLDGNAVDTIGTSFDVSTSAGADSVTITDTPGVSVPTTIALGNLNIDTGAGDDTVNILGEHTYAVTTAGGSDFVNIDSDNGIHTGSWSIGDNSVSGGLDWDARVLYEATVTVDFAGFSETVAINTTVAGDFVATQVDINDAVKNAIDSNPELARLLTYTDGDGIQVLNIMSTIDGQNDLTINVTQPTVLATGPAGAGQVVVSSAHFSALEAGFLATEETFEAANEFDSGVISAGTEAADIQSVFDGTWALGSEDQNGNLNEVGDAVANDFVLDTADGTDGTTTAVAANSFATIDLGAGSNDLVVLDNNLTSANTVVFSANWGKVSVVNFFTEQYNDVAGNLAVANTTVIDHTDEIAALHILDFTAWLDDQNSTSTSSDSAERDITVSNVLDSVAAIDLDSNLVNILNDFTGTISEDWDGLNGAELEVALNGTVAADDYANISAVATAVATMDQGTLLGTSIDSILMIENDTNDGEYKVYNVETTDLGLAGEAYNVTAIGIIDFGETLDTGVVDTNFA